MSNAVSVQGLVIVGAGPGGMAPLFAAVNKGKLTELLQAGITVIERGSAVGRGTLGEHELESDSSAEALLDVVMASREPLFVNLRNHAATLHLLSFGKGPAPLKVVAQFLQAVSEAVCAMISASRRGRVLLNAQALSVRATARGSWVTTWVGDDSTMEEAESWSVVLATGAHQPAERLQSELVAGEPLLPRYSGKVMQTGVLFSVEGMSEARKHLQRKEFPKVAIVGGSTSAVSAADLLLQRSPSFLPQPCSVTILHRKPLRLLYESVEEALADGYTDFRPADVCRLTGRVYRLGGLRLRSRELIMGALGVGSRTANPALRLLSLAQGIMEEARSVLRDADLIVAAFGYRPRLLAVYDAQQRQVPLLSPVQQRWAAVDENSCLLDAERRPQPGLFAVGLAVGPAASERLGGEAGFPGQVNSLWLWQHTIGEQICEQVVARVRTTLESFRSARPSFPVTQNRNSTLAQALRTVSAQEAA